MRTLGPWAGGINNAISPTQIREAPSESGAPAFLTDAVNVDIDRDGLVRTRTGWAVISGAAAHSLFEHAGLTYGVVDGYLCRITGTNAEQIRAVEGRLAWCVLNGEPVYAAHNEVRVVRGLAAHALPFTQLDDEEELVLAPLPGGSHVAYWQGRLLVVRGNSLLWSEPLRFGAYNPLENYVRFEERITWLAPLDSGVYLGLRNTVRWLAGTDPAQFTQTVVGGASWAGAGAAVDAAGMNAGTTNNAEEVALWLTERGFAMGLPNGTVVYPQSDRLSNIPLGTGRLVVSGDRITVISR